MRRIVGWAALLLLLAALLVPVVVLTFSVRVSGLSMAPTLREGDRLFVDLLGRDDLERLDLVEAQLGPGASRAVKRVIGLPGDVVRVTYDDERPVVTVERDGTTYRVVNPAWDDQVGTAQRPCCEADGTAGGTALAATVPDGAFWLVGDNWGGSDDSRTFGFVPQDRIGGRLNWRVLPLGDLGRVDHDVRLEPVR